MAYADLLRDPRWQRKRLEVMQAAGFACECCHATDKTLNVHHVRYVRGRMPWDYDRAELECLCEACHKDEHGIGEQARLAAAKAKLRAECQRFKAEHPEAIPVLYAIAEINRLVPDASFPHRVELTTRKVALLETLRSMGGAKWGRNL